MGFRTASGHIANTQSLKTLDIPKRVRGRGGGRNAWDAGVAMNFGQRFLAFIRSVASGDNNGDETVVWRVRFIPRNGMKMWKLDAAGVAEVAHGEDRVGFLPGWFCTGQ